MWLQLKDEELKNNILLEQMYERFKEDIEELDVTMDDHPGMKGGNIEKLVEKFLANFLPKKYTIARNKKLLDIEGNASKEQDIVIWNKIDMPRIYLEEKDFLSLESIYGTIEVKRTLDSKTLKDAILNIQNYRKLKNHFNNEKRNQKLEGVHILGGEVEGYQLEFLLREKDLYAGEINHPPLAVIVAYEAKWQKNDSLHDISPKSKSKRRINLSCSSEFFMPEK